MSRAGEIAVIVVCTATLSISIAALAGLGTASWLAGGGWVWPPDSHTGVRVLGALVAGHPGQGLPPKLAMRVPGPVAVYVGVAFAEMLLLLLAGVAGVVLARYYRPRDARAGMATRAQAAQVLGMTRLREGKALIRPDLYGHASHRSFPSRDQAEIATMTPTHTTTEESE